MNTDEKLDFSLPEEELDYEYSDDENDCYCVPLKSENSVTSNRDIIDVEKSKLNRDLCRLGAVQNISNFKTTWTHHKVITGHLKKWRICSFDAVFNELKWVKPATSSIRNVPKKHKDKKPIEVLDFAITIKNDSCESKPNVDSVQPSETKSIFL